MYPNSWNQQYSNHDYPASQFNQHRNYNSNPYYHSGRPQQQPFVPNQYPKNENWVNRNHENWNFGNYEHWNHNNVMYSDVRHRNRPANPYRRGNGPYDFNPRDSKHFSYTPQADVALYNLPVVQKSKSNSKQSYHNFNTPLVEQLLLDCEVSSQKISLRWKPVSGRKDIKYVIYCTDKEGHRWNSEQPWTQTHKDLKTSAGNTYNVIVECRSVRDNTTLGKAEKDIKSVFSYDEQKELYNKAFNFVSGNMQQFEVLYRCKPKIYWDQIYHHEYRIMQKYIKDDNGQPANLINGVLTGLFFSARLSNDGSLPHTSPFGNVRMIIDAHKLLDPNRHNFYFSDFYCNYVTHYVTVVVAVKGSSTDKYCYTRLHKLDPEDNPFLRVVRMHDPYYPNYCTFYVSKGVWVEIYFTEDIPLSEGRFDSIEATGAGTSKIGGLPNNKHCEMCNLYPLAGYYDEEEPDHEVEDDDDDLFDITVTDSRALNSTFLKLIEENKKHEMVNFDDPAEAISCLIDTVCQKEEERKLKKEDPINYSDEKINNAVAKMVDRLTACKNEKLFKVKDFISDFINQFRADRDSIFKASKEIGSLVKIQQNQSSDA